MDYEAVKYVEGFVENIIYRNEDNGYTVFNIMYKSEEVTCVGMFSYISAGEFITAEGEFTKHPVYYMQFQVKSYELKVPDDAKSVKRYLGSGAIKGIGEKTKNDLLKTFKSVKRIKEADFAELENSIGKNRASIIYTYFHGTLTPRE